MTFAASFLRNLITVAARRRRQGPAHPEWGIRLETTVETLRQGGEAQLRGTLEEWRRGQEETARTVWMARGVRERERVVGGRPALELTPTDRSPTSAFLYLHGGGYVTGSSRTHRALVSRIVAATGAMGVVLDYRLAPEHPFPAAIEDAALAITEMIEEHGHHVWIAGDSAGGGLALATMCALRDRGARLPWHGVLLCPWVDLEGSHPSIAENLPFDWGDRRTLDFYAAHYAKDERRHPLSSPIHASLRGLPPLLIQYGDAELLRDECRTLVANAQRDGVLVQGREWKGMVHDFQLFAPLVPQSRAAIAEIAAFVAQPFAPTFP